MTFILSLEAILRIGLAPIQFQITIMKMKYSGGQVNYSGLINPFVHIPRHREHRFRTHRERDSGTIGKLRTARPTSWSSGT